MGYNYQKKLPKVAVLMSTYNGEKYIREQIDSILCQEGVEVDLFIRDDGSSDSTLDIISDYTKRDNVFVVPSDRNLGSGMSFLTLLHNIAKKMVYSYYAFADQDDIWFSQKLKVGIKHLQDYHNIPTLYAGNTIIYINGENHGYLFDEQPDISLQREISQNEIRGCTMVFNSLLAKQISMHHIPCAELIDYRLHDTWLLLVALVTGKVIYDPDAYIFYRIHDNNVVGLNKTGFGVRIRRIFKIGNGRTPRSNLRQKTAKLLLEYYPDMDQEKKIFLEKYAYYQESFKRRRELMADRDLIAATKENPLVFKIKVLTNFV